MKEEKSRGEDEKQKRESEEVSGGDPGKGSLRGWVSSEGTCERQGAGRVED